MKKQLSLPSLEAHLGYWLRFVSNHISHAFRLKLEEQGVTVAEWVVLRELFNQAAMSPTDLAARLGLTKGAISKLVDRLTEKSLLERSFNEKDRRRQTLSLTPQGRQLVPILCDLADSNDTAFFGHLKPEEQALLKAMMIDIVERHGFKARPVD